MTHCRFDVLDRVVRAEVEEVAAAVVVVVVVVDFLVSVNSWMGCLRPEAAASVNE